MGDERPRAAVVQLMRYFALAVAGVDCGDNRARLEDAVEGDDELRAVGGENRHPLAALHAQSRQPRREIVRKRLEVGVGENPLAVYYRRLAAPLPRRPRQQFLKRNRLIRSQRPPQLPRRKHDEPPVANCEPNR